MEQNFCQSCGMPLNEQHYSTNKDGSANTEYCNYCYKEGEFTWTDATMDDMIKHCVQYLEDFNKDSGKKFTEEEAISQMKQFFPHLKRWKA